MLESSTGCSIVRPMLHALAGGERLENLQLVTCPVLLAWPADDRILPAATCASRFLRELPQAEFRSLAGVGHAPMSDEPELVARTILDVTARR